VQGVSFSLERGERLGLVGESGCGKSTTILALMGLLPPSASVSGQVLLEGRDLLAGGEQTVRPNRWRDLAMVFQGAMNALNPVQTIQSQLVEPMELHGVARGRAARARAAELLEAVGIPAARAGRYPHELSGGMRQRAAMAMALACRPKVLLVDEPTTALDVMVQAQVLERLVGLTEELGLALVLVTHDLPVVAQVCERAAVMYSGEIVEAGPVRSLYLQPRHPYTRLLFASTPDLRGGRQVASIPGRAAAPGPGADRLPVPAALRRGAARLLGRAPGPAGRRRRAPGRLPPQRPARAEPGVSAPADPAAPRADAAAGVEASEASGSPPLLEVSGLVTRYPLRRGVVETLERRPRLYVNAVDGVCLTLDRGEMLALVGESGCGKTTTALSIPRLVEPSAGTVRFLGRDVNRLPARELRALRRRMQLIYQDRYESLDPGFTVSRTVEEPLLVHGEGGGRAARRRRVTARRRWSADLTPPGMYLERYPHELSGGQRQRVAIASSLVLEPELLVADGPVSMLDVSVRAGVLALLDGLRSERGLGILMITHDLSTAASFADRIAVMYLGRIVEQGRPPGRRQRAAPLHEGAAVGRSQARPRRRHRAAVAGWGAT
jgi:peptide/nickel transport system ATP-binding protein